ncbi:putative sugar O-methyltransferase [Methylotuvimicrobium sp. KM1]|uniref:putative sugar O-methyltransferase n=1 Tax=Methylotuvimicrobium sp. KM1 TaxID=3377707 RepID=UPI00384E8CA8
MKAVFSNLKNKILFAISFFRAKIILPRDSNNLTQKEFETALKICDYINNVIQNRDSYIKNNSLDVSINNPAANWSLHNSFFDGFRALVSRKFEHINMLRVFSQMFSGNYLGVKHAEGLHVPQTVPKKLDYDVLSYLNSDPIWWKERYINLIAMFPQIGALTPPRDFGESGVIVGNVLVNHDTYVYLERIALLVKYGVVEKLNQRTRPVILEIGCGYGALAYFIKKLVPNCTYICVDLPESLIFSGIYLTRYFEDYLLVEGETTNLEVNDSECVFVPNYMFHKLPESNSTIDLAINTLSMSEMTPEQVAYYCRGLAAMLGRNGIFYEQNQDNRHIGLTYAKEIVQKYFDQQLDMQLMNGLTQGSATLWANSEDALS